MLCGYSHTNSERLAQIRATFAEIDFLGDGFWHTLYTSALCLL